MSGPARIGEEFAGIRWAHTASRKRECGLVSDFDKLCLEPCYASLQSCRCLNQKGGSSQEGGSMIDCAGRPGGVHLGCPASFSASQDRGRTPVTLDNRASEDLLGVEKKICLPLPSIAFYYTNLVEAIRITATCVCWAGSWDLEFFAVTAAHFFFDFLLVVCNAISLAAHPGWWAFRDYGMENLWQEGADLLVSMVFCGLKPLKYDETHCRTLYILFQIFAWTDPFFASCIWYSWLKAPLVEPCWAMLRPILAGWCLYGPLFCQLYLIQLVESPTCRANLGHVGRVMPLRTPFLPAVSDTAGWKPHL